MAFSIIDEYLLDFDIVASSINIASIPSLKKWIHKTIYDNIRHKAIWPNQIRLFGPGDHFNNVTENIKINPNEFEYSEPIMEIKEDIITKKSLPKKEFVVGVSLFFPEGKENSPPDGFELLDKTCTGNYAANLNSGSKNQRNVYICVKKDVIGSPITDISVVNENNLEDLPPEYRVIRVTYCGEEAYIKQIFNKNDNSNITTFLCYEKGNKQSGYIEDIKIMFDEEIIKVRELKHYNQSQEIDAFPIGYTMLEINNVLQANGNKKRIFLCLKRVGGTKLKSLIKKR